MPIKYVLILKETIIFLFEKFIIHYFKLNVLEIK